MLSPTRDRLTGGAAAGIPADADQVLREVGVPRDAVLDGWVGPTLFSSELVSGKATVVAQRWPTLASHEHARSFVLGRIREQDSDLEHAAFVLKPAVGSIFLVDLDGRVSRFVNTHVGAFLACMETFVAWWDALVRRQQLHGPPSPEDGERELRVLATALVEVDARSLTDAEAYWRGWIDDLRTL